MGRTGGVRRNPGRSAWGEMMVGYDGGKGRTSPRGGAETAESHSIPRQCGPVEPPVAAMTKPEHTRSRPSAGPRPAPRLALRLGRTVLVPAVIVGVLGMTGWMERLFYMPEAGPTPPPPGAEMVRFESADGTRLAGWFLPAAGSAGAAAATILHIHGNAGNMESHLGFSDHLPPAGMNLFLFDFRGYGESAGKPTRREDLIADASAALDAILARPDVDASRIGLFGQSLGGGIGLNLMAGREEIRAAVIVSSFTSWRDMAASAVGGPVGGALATVLIRDHLRPDDAIARIDRPILLIHGDADPIVPVEHARRLLKAAPNAKLEVLAGGDHNNIRATNPEFDELTITFFERELK